MYEDEVLIKCINDYQHSLNKYAKNRNNDKLLHVIRKFYKLPIKVTHLEQTGIGRTVNGLRKLGGDVGDAAKALVARWKEMVVQEEEEKEKENNVRYNRDNGGGAGSSDSEGDGEAEGEARGGEDSDSGVERESYVSDDEEEEDNIQTIDYSSRNASDDKGCDGSGSRKRPNDGDVGSDAEEHVEKKRKSDDYNYDYSTPSSSRKQDLDSGFPSVSSSVHEKGYNDDSSDSESEKVHEKHTKEKRSEDRRHKHEKSDNRKDKRKDLSGKNHHSSDSEKRHKDKHKSHKEREKEKDKGHKEKRHKDDKHKNREDKHKHHEEKRKSSDKSDRKDKHSKRHEDKSKLKSKSKDDEDKPTKSYKSDKSDKSDKSSSKSKVKKTVNGEIDCNSGTSFAEALGMLTPSTSFDKAIAGTSYSPSEKSRSDKAKKQKKESPHKSEKTEIPKPLSDPIKLSSLDLKLDASLPPITPNYRPLGNMPFDVYQKKLSDSEALSRVISQKNIRTKVYSGNKVTHMKVPSLFEMCIRVLQDNIDALEYTGGVPYSVLKPVLEKASATQLFTLEHHNPYLIEDSDELWQLHCQCEFRNKTRDEMETWREMYMRCIDERNARLKALTATIKQAQDKSLPVRTTKLAYVDSVVKPPREVARKQAKNGTAQPPGRKLTSTASKLSSLATAGEAGKVAVPNPGARAVDNRAGASSSAAVMKPKKAPLMAKSLLLLKNRFRR